MHLLMDCYGGSKEQLESLEAVYNELDKCPKALGLTKIAPPYVFRYVGLKPKDWGITGIVLIAESHISIHTFPEHLFTNIDVFSCKWFDSSAVVAHLRSTFGFEQIESTVLNRGLEYARRLIVEGAPHDRRTLSL